MYSLKSEFTIKGREATDKEDAPSGAKSLVSFTSLKKPLVDIHEKRNNSRLFEKKIF